MVWGLDLPLLQPCVPYPRTRSSRLCFTLLLPSTRIEKSLAQTPTGFLCWELTSVANSPPPSTGSLELPERPWLLARLSSQALESAQGPTFVGARERPEVLCLFLEVLLPDFLDLNQVEDS